MFIVACWVVTPCVVWQVGTDDSDEYTTPIFREESLGSLGLKKESLNPSQHSEQATDWMV
jgi:hypothetical protein